MINSTQILNGITHCQYDIPHSLVQEARKIGAVALDIETSGLNWKEDQIGTCQLFIPSGKLLLIHIGSTAPKNLCTILQDSEITKIFHHAMFDLRFISYKWPIHSTNIVCTKIASKIISPSSKQHSLKDLLNAYLSIQIDKKMQTSDWLSNKLTEEQILYAVKDVYYLPNLYKVLKEELKKLDRWRLAQASFDYIPTRVQLDILEAGDVFQY